MPAPSSSLLLALALWAGVATAAPPSIAPCGPGAQRIELKAGPVGEVPEVCISPGVATLLSFDADLSREAVTLEGLERFAKVDLGDSTLKLVPSERILPGVRLLLTVRFKDGADPKSATFWLRVHPARATSLVEVYRQRRPLESCQQEVRITALLEAGLMDIAGVIATDITRTVSVSQASALHQHKVVSYRSSQRVAVEITLRLLQDGPPWRAVGAELVRPGHQALRMLPPWQQEPIHFGGTEQRVLLEAEATAKELQGTFTLKLWDADGARSAILTGVTFP